MAIELMQATNKTKHSANVMKMANFCCI